MVAFDNASTVVLGLINCSAPTQVFPLDETGIQRSVAMTAGATSTGVFYTPKGTTVERRIVSSVTSNTPVALQRLAPPASAVTYILSAASTVAATVSRTPTQP